MDIHVDIHGFLEIHAWICYGFSDEGHAVGLYIRPKLDSGELKKKALVEGFKTIKVYRFITYGMSIERIGQYRSEFIYDESKLYIFF